jgi:hypothetical protein
MSMKTLGRGSLASILKFVLDATWYILWAVLVFVSLVLVSTAVAFLLDIMGYAPGLPSALTQSLSDHGKFFPLFIPLIIALMVVVDRLRRILATLVAGDPFVPENAGHLRVIAFGIAAYQILVNITQGAVAMILTLLGQTIEGGETIDMAWQIDLGAWLAVGVLLVFSEVFREGARMRQEQKLTI